MANPVITLNGPDPLVLTQGQPYVDPGARAIDDAGVDISSSIRVSPTVIDTSAMSSGIPVTYEVTDARGESASRTRMVKIDPAPTPAPPAPPAPPVPPAPTPGPSRLASARSVALRVLAALAMAAFAALLIWVIYLIIQNLRGAPAKLEGGKLELGSNAATAIQSVAKDFFGRENARFELRLDSGTVSQPARQPVIVVSTTQPASRPAPRSVAIPEVRHYGWIWHRSCPKEAAPASPPSVVQPQAAPQSAAPRSPTFLSPKPRACRPEVRVPTRQSRSRSEIRGSAGQSVRREVEVVE